MLTRCCSSTPRSVTDPGANHSEASQHRGRYQNEPEAEATEFAEDRPTGQYGSSRYGSHHAHNSGYDRTWATTGAITSNYGRQAINSGAGQPRYSTAEGHDLATQAQHMSLETNHDNHEGEFQDHEYALSGQGDPIPEEEKVPVKPKHITGTSGERETLDKSRS